MTSPNNLVHEVYDNFDFEQQKNEGNDNTSNVKDTKIFDIETSASVKSNKFVKNCNTQQIVTKDTDVNEFKNNKKFNYLIDSPTTSSYFNSNFDENGYVFDGIKIDVTFKKFK
jgi:hypothetical protein